MNWNIEDIPALARAIIFFWTVSITAAGVAALTALVLGTKPPVGLFIVVGTIAAMFGAVALVRRLIA